jgi:hypothetical protein
MLVCPKCKGPMAPLFASYYCKRECDRKPVVHLMAYKRFDNQEVILITNIDMLPETWRESIWIDNGTGSIYPRTVMEACGRDYSGTGRAGGWVAKNPQGNRKDTALFLSQGWGLLILP